MKVLRKIVDKTKIDRIRNLGCQKIDYHAKHCNIDPKEEGIQEDFTVVGRRVHVVVERELITQNCEWKKKKKIRSLQIRELCGIQPINEWMARIRRREWDVNVTRMDTEKLVKISKDNVPVGRRSPGRSKRRWIDLILD